MAHFRLFVFAFILSFLLQPVFAEESSETSDLTTIDKIERIRADDLEKLRAEIDEERRKNRQQHLSMSREYYDTQAQKSKLRIQKAKLARDLSDPELTEEEMSRIKNELDELENAIAQMEEDGMANRARVVRMYRSAEDDFRGKVDRYYQESLKKQSS